MLQGLLPQAEPLDIKDNCQIDFLMPYLSDCRCLRGGAQLDGDRLSDGIKAWQSQLWQDYLAKHNLQLDREKNMKRFDEEKRKQTPPPPPPTHTVTTNKTIDSVFQAP